MIESIFSTPPTVLQIVICLGAGIVAGILNALIFSFRSRSSSSFAITMALCPAAMSMVVLVINGNLGVAVAVAGGFALVRFRSIPGTGKEIIAIFINMTTGVILGMGYVYIAALFFAVTAVIVLILSAAGFGERKHEKYLKITIPEDYDYVGLFDDIFEKYHAKAVLERIKTTNMGSLIDVTYRINLAEPTVPKEMLDELRARNANLSIVVTNSELARPTL
ncbi:MAG: DUF4956 domain-containing protein [Parasporobacterium sp.]|nr:DUF4956 domain-containing protein [Parasporobacterium sp.]